MLNGVAPGLLPVGSVVALLPSHCDATVNQHVAFVGLRDGVVEAVFPIDARGPGS